MRTLVASFLALAAVGCPANHPDVQCKVSPDCDQPGMTGGSCDVNPETGNHWCSYTDGSCPSGRRWATSDTGDGLAGQCVADTNPDANLSPDARPVIDANTTDAMPGEIVADNQPADLVLGQMNFTTATENAGGISAKSMDYPNGVTAAGSDLWVTDSSNGRALRFDPPPQISFTAALQLLGKFSFTDGSDYAGADSISINHTCCGNDVATSGTRLLVSDSGAHRVMVWTPLPNNNGQTVTFVLGQTSPTVSLTPSPGNAATKLNTPTGLWTDGTRVAVADTGNHRVLIWNTFPTTNGQAADLVLGQSDFGLSTVPSTPSASSMNGPRGVYFDGTHFFVADTGNNRVLVWNGFPTAKGQAADFVIGQPDFTSKTFGTSDHQLGLPRGITVASGALFVADYQNNRVLVFDPVPTASGAVARHVLGQPSFTIGAVPSTPSDTNMHFPSDVVVIAKTLWVADSWQHRVLRFTLAR
jgi:hypothetical protein